jgi:hypothetical protein
MKSSEKNIILPPLFASISQLADTRKKDTPKKNNQSIFSAIFTTN